MLGGLERLSSELSGTATQHAKAIAERAADTAEKARDEDAGAPSDNANSDRKVPPRGDEEDTKTMPASKSAS